MAEPRHVNQYPIEVRQVTDPAGRQGVLLQLGGSQGHDLEGFVILRPQAALAVADALTQVAGEVMRDEREQR